MSLFFLFCLVLLQRVCQSVYVSSYPVCASTVFDYMGFIDIPTMLTNCSNNIPASLDPASYFATKPGGSTYAPTNVSVQLALDNLINVDDVGAAITLDLYFRIYWTDPRINLPDIFNYTNPECKTEGIDITSYIRNPATPLNFWLPDVFFYVISEYSVIAELIKIFPNSLMFWSRHLTITIPQPTMSYLDYPLDTQNFSFVLQSFAYDYKFVSLSFVSGTAVKLLTNPQYSSPMVTYNQLWTYNTYSSYVYNAKSPSTTNPNRKYSTAVIDVTFTRQKYGIVLRLALPVTIFLLIVGFSFWADPDKRVDIALNMTLVVAALYLVIGQVIPFVGYFTAMDTFVTMAFILLSGIVAVHFLTQILDRTADAYPLHKIICTAMILFFRLAWIPIALMVFVVMFQVNLVPILAVLYLTTVVSLLSAAYALRTEFPGLFKETVFRLRAKYAEKEGVVTLQKPNLLELLEKAVLRVTRNMYRMTDENTIALGSLVGAVGAEALVFSNPGPGTASKRFTLRSSEAGVELNPMQRKSGSSPTHTHTDAATSDSTTIVISKGAADSDDEYG